MIEYNDFLEHTFTNIQQMRENILNSMVSKNIHDQGKTLFCWAFASSTMLRQSLKLFISQQCRELDQTNVEKALKKLNHDSFHRQLRNELFMIPIPKNPSTKYNQQSRLFQGHYLDLVLQRVKQFNSISNLNLNFS